MILGMQDSSELTRSLDYSLNLSKTFASLLLTEVVGKRSLNDLKLNSPNANDRNEIKKGDFQYGQGRLYDSGYRCACGCGCDLWACEAAWVISTVNRHRQFSSSTAVAEFAQINPLPGSQVKPAVHYGNCDRGAYQ